MRIISDFKDYYDSAQMHGQDPSLLYMRKQERFEVARRFHLFDATEETLPPHLLTIFKTPLARLDELPHTFYKLVGRETVPFEIPITVKIIGFCGFLYPAIAIDEQVFYETTKVAASVPRKYLRSFHIDDRDLEEMLSFKPQPHIWNRGWRTNLTHELWKTKTDEVRGKRFDDIFISLNVPAFTVELETENKRNGRERIRCILNPFLKNEQFQKVKSPTEAYQEIAMYLGNQLAKQPDPVAQISDEIMRDEKGFDKWSFRRHKEEDKKFRKKNPPSK